MLFTVVSREEKYAAKLVIDTVVQRAGDLAAAAAFEALRGRLQLGTGALPQLCCGDLHLNTVLAAAEVCRVLTSCTQLALTLAKLQVLA